MAGMSRRKVLTFGVAVMLVLSAGGFVFLQHRLVAAAETLLTPYSSPTTATEFHKDGTTTVYASAEERVRELRPDVHRVVSEHAADIDRIFDIRHAAALPSTDLGAEPTGINLTVFQRHPDLACAEFKRGVHLPWLKDDVNELCRKVEARQVEQTRDFIYAIASSHVSRRCTAAHGAFDADYPTTARKELRERWDRGTLDMFVPQEAAAADPDTAEVKSLWDDLEADLDALVTEHHCFAAFPDLADPLTHDDRVEPRELS